MIEVAVDKLKEAWRLPCVSVSEVYPNDDGYLRREVVVQIDGNRAIGDIHKLCGDIACALKGEFHKVFRIEGNQLSFIVSYNEHVDPPPAWKVVRENPL